jgi:hypothetical protein
MAGLLLEREPGAALHPRLLAFYGIQHVEPPPNALRLQFRPELVREVRAQADNEDISDEALLMRSGAKYLYDQASGIWHEDNSDESKAVSRKAGIAVAHRILRRTMEEHGGTLPEVDPTRAHIYTAEMRGRPEKLMHWFDAVTSKHGPVKNLLKDFSTDAAIEGAKLLIGLYGEFINPGLKLDVQGRVPIHVSVVRPQQVPHASPRISVSKQARRH